MTSDIASFRRPSRSDVYQSVSFAAAYEVTRACIVSFARREFKILPEAQFGTITVSHVPWDQDIPDPVEAEHDFVERIRSWLFDRSPHHKLYAKGAADRRAAAEPWAEVAFETVVGC